MPFQPSFSRGEIAPGLRNRVDLALYGSALATCRNFRPLRLGGVQTRPGMALVSPASRESVTARLIRFVYSRTQSYLLEFCAGRVWVYQNGARLTFGDPAATLADVTSLTENGIAAVTVSPTYFTLQTYISHGWSDGDVVRVSGVTGTGEIVHANGVHEITAPTVNTIRVPRLSSGAASWTSTTTGRVSRCVSVATPYIQDELADLRVTQSADVMTVFSRSHPPHELRRTSATTFTFAERDYDTGPFQRDNSDPTVKIHASATRGTVTLTATLDVFVAAHVGALIRLDQEENSAEPWEPANGTSAGALCRYGENTYIAVSSGTTGNTPPEHTNGREKDGQGSYVEWEYQHSGYGVARITAVTDARTATATVLSRFPKDVVGGTTTAHGPWTMTGDGSDTTLSVTGATSDFSSDYEVTLDGVIQDADSYTVDSTSDVLTFATAPATGVAVSAKQLGQNRRTSIWSLGAWSDVQGYPGRGTYYGERLVFGSTNLERERLDLTEIGNYDGFEASVPGLDSDPFDRQLGGREQTDITDLVPMSQLLALTTAGPYRLAGGDQNTLTPRSAAPLPLDGPGAADCPAVKAGPAALFIGRGRERIHDLLLDSAGGSAITEVSLGAAHLLRRGRTAELIDYQENPESTAWTVRSDGRLLSLTYLKEQDVLGWGWHETDGTVEQVCVVPEADEDVVYLLVKRTINEVERRFIERLVDREPDDPRDLVCVDSALTFDGRITDGRTMTLYDLGSGLEANASAPSFTAADVGKEVWVDIPEIWENDVLTRRAGSVHCLILAYVNTNKVRVQADRDIPTDVYAVPTPDWAIATRTLTGASHLAGATVAVQIDAGVHDPVTVAADGSIELTTHTAVAHVGLAFTANIKTLPINFVGRETVRPRSKAVPSVTVLMVESNGLEAGPDAAHLEAFEGRAVEDEYELPAEYEGAGKVRLKNTWEDTGSVELWQRNPLPLTIVGVIPDVRVGR